MHRKSIIMHAHLILLGSLLLVSGCGENQPEADTTDVGSDTDEGRAACIATAMEGEVPAYDFFNCGQRPEGECLSWVDASRLCRSPHMEPCYSVLDLGGERNGAGCTRCYHTECVLIGADW